MGRRTIIKLKKDETALIIRNDNDIEVIGEKHKGMFIQLASVLFTDNEQLVADIKENYLNLQKAELAHREEMKNPKSKKEEIIDEAK